MTNYSRSKPLNYQRIPQLSSNLWPFCRFRMTFDHPHAISVAICQEHRKCAVGKFMTRPTEEIVTTDTPRTVSRMDFRSRCGTVRVQVLR